MEPSQILNAQDEYEAEGPHLSLSEWLNSRSEAGAWAIVMEAVGELPVRSMRQILGELATEYESSDRPTTAFQGKAVAFMWMLMLQISELREDEF